MDIPPGCLFPGSNGAISDEYDEYLDKAYDTSMNVKGDLTTENTPV